MFFITFYNEFYFAAKNLYIFYKPQKNKPKLKGFSDFNASIPILNSKGCYNITAMKHI